MAKTYAVIIVDHDRKLVAVPTGLPRDDIHDSSVTNAKTEQKRDLWYNTLDHESDAPKEIAKWTAKGYTLTTAQNLLAK